MHSIYKMKMSAIYLQAPIKVLRQVIEPLTPKILYHRTLILSIANTIGQIFPLAKTVRFLLSTMLDKLKRMYCQMVRLRPFIVAQRPTAHPMIIVYTKKIRKSREKTEVVKAPALQTQSPITLALSHIV